MSTLTLDLDVILDCIHWSQGAFFQALVRGDIFPQRTALRCTQEMSGFPRSKSLSPHRTDSPPSLALVRPPPAPSITLPHRDQRLTLTPFSCGASFFTHLKHQGLLLRKTSKHPWCAQTCTPITPRRWLAELLFPNQKQTAINRAPSLLSHTGQSLNLRSPDAQLTPGLFHSFSGSRQ